MITTALILLLTFFYIACTATGAQAIVSSGKERGRTVGPLYALIFSAAFCLLPYVAAILFVLSGALHRATTISP